jgi:hypothetical protein
MSSPKRRRLNTTSAPGKPGNPFFIGPKVCRLTIRIVLSAFAARQRMRVKDVQDTAPKVELTVVLDQDEPTSSELMAAAPSPMLSPRPGSREEMMALVDDDARAPPVIASEADQITR